MEVANQAQADGLITSAPGYSHLLCRLSDFRLSQNFLQNYFLSFIVSYAFLDELSISDIWPLLHCMDSNPSHAIYISDTFLSLSRRKVFYKKILTHRSSLTEVSNYGHIPVPLVYTQVKRKSQKWTHLDANYFSMLKVVHLAVYVYFAVSLIGEQWIIWRAPGDEEIDLYYPIFMTVRLDQNKG